MACAGGGAGTPRPSVTPLAATAFSTSLLMLTKSMRAGTFIVRWTVWDEIRGSERPEAAATLACRSENGALPVPGLLAGGRIVGGGQPSVAHWRLFERLVANGDRVSGAD